MKPNSTQLVFPSRGHAVLWGFFALYTSFYPIPCSLYHPGKWLVHPKVHPRLAGQGFFPGSMLCATGHSDGSASHTTHSAFQGLGKLTQLISSYGRAQGQNKRLARNYCSHPQMLTHNSHSFAGVIKMKNGLDLGS